MKHSLKGVVRAGWTNFKRNNYLSFAVVGVMVLVLMLFLGLVSFQVLTARLTTSLKEKVDISAYFKVETPEENILAIKTDLEKLPEVKSVAYISRDQAQADFKVLHADDELIQESLAQLESNPFEAALNVKAQDPERYGTVATFLENSRFKDNISKINYNENKDVIDRINRIAHAMRNWGLITTLIIAIIAILITFNTIRLTIYNQKQEIEIMRLVGASNWHIRGPFLAEGAFYGIFAALIGLLIFYPIVLVSSGKIAAFVPDINLGRYFVHNMLQIVLITFVVGMLLGILSSIIAMRRHLKI